MPQREVEVEVSLSVIAEGEQPVDARAKVAQRVALAVEDVEGKTEGIAVGTSGGEVVDRDG